MIAGLASLIPNGRLWLETSKSGKTSQLVLTPHKLKKNNHTVIKIKPHHFINRRVLIITNEYTASAAEFTIIALKRNHNVKTIGYPTGGYITSNTGFKFGPSKKYIALIPYARIISLKPINNKKIFSNDPIAPDIQTLYRPLNNFKYRRKIRQSPLDKDFIKELEQHIND